MSLIKKNLKNSSYFLINFIFCFFPISFILGSFFLNLNFLLFCCFGLYYLRSEIFKHKYNNIIKVIFSFFLVVFISTSISFIKVLYFDNYHDWELDRFLKSILYFRYFLLILIIYLTIKFNILNFKFFFLTAALSSLILSLDLIFQYIFGFNTFGWESDLIRNSGFFGTEYIAGGYLQRFSFFSIFFTFFLFKKKKYFKYISTFGIICILAGGIFASGNRMPLIIFTFGFFIILFFNIKIKKVILSALGGIFIFLSFMFWSDQSTRALYSAFFNHAQNIITITDSSVIDPVLQVKECANFDAELEKKCIFFRQKLGSDSGVVWESFHRRLFLTAVDTWKFNKIIGNGIKSFRHDCNRLNEQFDTSTDENLLPGMKNRLCANHPHNYYLEILTETGIVGMIIIIILMLSILSILRKNYKFINEKSFGSIFFLAVSISLILETFPIRSSGSFFTTNNTTYLALILGFFLCYEKILKTNTR